MHQSVIRRTLAAGASAAVAVTGMAAFASPAQAASAPLNFDCSVVGTNYNFVTTADTDMPAEVTAGTKVPVKVTATVVVPDEVRTTLANLTAATVSGTADIVATVNGKEVKVSATIPSTPVPASGALTVQASGAVEVTPEGTGQQAVKVVKYEAKLDLRTAAGAPTPLISSATVPCTPKAGQDLTVDTFTVKSATTPPPAAGEAQATKTTSTATYKKKAKKAVVKVSVANADGTAAAGDVKVVMKKGKKKFKSTVTLNAKGKGKAAFTKVAPGKYKLTVSYTGSDASKKSKKTGNVKLK